MKSITFFAGCMHCVRHSYFFLISDNSHFFLKYKCFTNTFETSIFSCINGNKIKCHPHSIMRNNRIFATPIFSLLSKIFFIVFSQFGWYFSILKNLTFFRMYHNFTSTKAFILVSLKSW